MSEKQKLLRTVQELGFTLIDLNMYLDAYASEEAFDYFKATVDKYRKATTEYETKYGPLTPASNALYDSWKWTTGAWPWETEANC